VKRVLIIHRSQEKRDGLSFALEKAGFRTAAAEDTEAGFRRLSETDPDVVIVADNSPGGQKLCSRIRDFSAVPLIVLGKGDGLASVMMLEKGADVYLNESVSSRELVAWVYSLLRR